MFMKKIVIAALACLMAISSSLYAQERTITGKVTDAADGSSLPGVNVLVVGTTTGTITNMDGDYSITVPSDNASLQFSFTGYTPQTISATGRNVIDVSLVISDVTLDDVVVTALGLSREKKALGYAITQVDGEVLSNVKESNVINSLAGRVAGVNLTQSTSGLGGGTMVILRGNSSLTGNNQPLYIIDGISIDNSGYGSAAGENTANYSQSDYGTGISDINPDDVASITVLKGPNAAALYGSRAANGVIVITTKKGKAGKGLGVSYSLQTTWEKPMILPKYQNQYGQGQDGLTYANVDDLRQYSSSWGAKMDGSSQMYWTDETRPYVAQEDNVKDFFRTGVNMVNTVAVDGGNENSTFRFSYSNNTNNGMLENSKLTRNNFNLRATTKINKLSLDGKVTYFKQDVKNRAQQGTEGLMAWVYTIPRNLVLADYKDYQNPADYSVKTFTDGTFGNPYWVLHNDVNKDNRERMQGFIKATYELTPDLSVFVRAGTDVVTQNIETVNQPGHWYFPSGRFDYSTRTTTESNLDFLIMYNKTFAIDWSLNLNAGGNMLYQTYTGQSVYGENFKIPTKPTTASAGNTVPSYDPLRKKQIHSLYGTASLSYKNFAYLDLSARNDWSSTLPEDNRSYFYPSVSLSFLLNEMLPSVGNIFNLAKIRGSWAQVGADTDPYQIESTYTLQQDGYLGLTTLTRPTVKMNADLKPERTSSIELGFEFAMFNNRFYGDFTYYNIESKDLIMDVPVPQSTGYSYFRENVGLMTNKGIELQLGVIPVKLNDFTWDLSLNFAKNKNELVELTEDLESLAFSTTNAGNIIAQATVGGGFGDFYGYTYLRDPNGNIVVDLNGVPRNSSERVYLGNWQPDWTAGMINTLTYKNLSMSFLIDMTKGGQIYSGTDAALNSSGVSDRTLQYRETGYTWDAVVNTGTEDAPVYEANTEAITAQEYWGGLPTSEYVYDKTNIRLRELSVSYKLPAKLLSNVFISDITFSLVGRNLFFLYKELDNFDPESSYSTNQYAQGMLYYNMPTARSIGFNLNIKF